MIDIHCHILPDVDDGAEDLKEALAMAELAVRSGVRDIIATPHFRGRAGETGKLPHMLRQLELLNRELEKAELPLRVHPGAEILCLPETVELAHEGDLPTLGRSR